MRSVFGVVVGAENASIQLGVQAVEAFDMALAFETTFEGYIGRGSAYAMQRNVGAFSV